MQTKPLLKKGLVVGIFFLLGANIVPLASGSFSEKAIVNEKWNPEPLSVSLFFNITFNGTMGKNNWYVSPVEIIIVFENDSYVAHFYYQIDNGNLTECTPPGDDLWVNKDGVHCFIGYFTDGQGNIEQAIGPFRFCIDQTPPTIVNFTAHRVGFFKWKLTADVYDNTSGINRVNFFVDSICIGNRTEPPYSMFWRGFYFLLRLKFFLYADWDAFPTCDVLDNAGNVYYLNIPSK